MRLRLYDTFFSSKNKKSLKNIEKNQKKTCNLEKDVIQYDGIWMKQCAPSQALALKYQFSVFQIQREVNENAEYQVRKEKS